MKTSELTGADLDYWVARALGAKAKMNEYNERGLCLVLEIDDEHGDGAGWFPFSPSSAWEQGGPIIEREQMLLMPYRSDLYCATIGAVGHPMCGDPIPSGEVEVSSAFGPTPLVAAMRAFVCSVFGEDVDATA